MNDVAETSDSDALQQVRSEIAAACTEARRDPAAVTLIAVSKTFPAEDDRAGDRGGPARVRREPRAGGERRSGRRYAMLTPASTLHLIGPLQSNKAKEAVALFDAIHSVDRASIAEALAKEIAKQGRHAAIVRGDQHRRRAAEGRRAPSGRGCLHQDVPRDIRPGCRRPDVHPAIRGGARAAFRAHRQDRSAQRRSNCYRWE